jgi:hypothetical protein
MNSVRVVTNRPGATVSPMQDLVLISYVLLVSESVTVIIS